MLLLNIPEIETSTVPLGPVNWDQQQDN